MSILMDEIDKLRKDISYIRDKMGDDSTLAYIKQDKYQQNKRRYDTDNTDYTYDSSDSSDSSSEFNENSSEGEYVYDERY